MSSCVTSLLDSPSGDSWGVGGSTGDGCACAVGDGLACVTCLLGDEGRPERNIHGGDG